MKTLLVLWDPANPIVPVSSVVEALRSIPEVQARSLTFDQLGHPTLPNGAFDLRPVLDGGEPDAILWIEGGPLPRDLSDFPCRKACWLVNTHHEPTLLSEVAPAFDVVFSASLSDSADEKAVWLPLAHGGKSLGVAPPGLSLLVDDPRPPRHAEVEEILRKSARGLGPLPVPIVVAMGNEGRHHPALLDVLLSGAAVLADPDTDLRGVAHVSEHLDVYPSTEKLEEVVRGLAGDPKRLSQLAARGPAIVHHLHEPAMRAESLCRGIWPRHEILSGREHRPRVSILVTCYRYLRRLRVCLESLARQDLAPGSLEVVVADPESPDGLAGALREFAERYPGLRVVRQPLDPRYFRNRGVGINRAFDASTGPVVVGIDGDLVFPPNLIGMLEARLLESPGRVLGVRRVFLGREDTEKILGGTLDPFEQFDRLKEHDGDAQSGSFVGVLGYCQAVLRKNFARARYPEEFDAVNQSDIVFVERLRRWAGVTPEYLPDQSVLHLWHPRNWAGTSEAL